MGQFMLATQSVGLHVKSQPSLPLPSPFILLPLYLLFLFLSLSLLPSPSLCLSCSLSLSVSPPPSLSVFSYLSLTLCLSLFVSLPPSLSGNDVQMIRAWNAIGDYYADRRKWYRPHLLAVFPALHSLLLPPLLFFMPCVITISLFHLCVIGNMLSHTTFKPATWRGWLKATTLWRTTPTWPSCRIPFPTTTSCLG